MKEPEYIENPAISSNGMLGDVVLALANPLDCMKFCEITIFADGKILLNWRGKEYGGEDGFFLTLRAAKMYVTKMIGYKSIWVREENNIA